MRARTPLLVLAASALALSACGGSDSGSDDAAGDNELGLITPGTLTMCSDIPYPPFEFEEGGEYTGFDVEMMQAVSKSLGLELAIKDIGFEGLQSGSALAAGTCDIGASAMTITEEREKNIDFSEPYYDSLQSLLVPTDSDIKGIDDLTGKVLGVQQGSTGEKYARDNVADDVKIKSYPSQAEILPALQSGNVDAVLQDLPVNVRHTDEGDLTIVEEYDTKEQYGFAFKEEGSDALQKAVNDEVAALREDGTYDELYAKYFSEKKK